MNHLRPSLPPDECSGAINCFRRSSRPLLPMTVSSCRTVGGSWR